MAGTYCHVWAEHYQHEPTHWIGSPGYESTEHNTKLLAYHSALRGSGAFPRLPRRDERLRPWSSPVVRLKLLSATSHSAYKLRRYLGC